MPVVDRGQESRGIWRAGVRRVEGMGKPRTLKKTRCQQFLPPSIQSFVLHLHSLVSSITFPPPAYSITPPHSVVQVRPDICISKVVAGFSQYTYVFAVDLPDLATVFLVRAHHVPDRKLYREFHTKQRMILGSPGNGVVDNIQV